MVGTNSLCPESPFRYFHLGSILPPKAYSEGIIKIFDAEGTLKSEMRQLEAGPILRLAAVSESLRPCAAKSPLQPVPIVPSSPCWGRLGIRTTCALWPSAWAGGNPWELCDPVWCGFGCGDEVSTITLPSFEFKTAFQALPGRDCGNWVSCQFSVLLQLLQCLISETLGQKTDSLLCAGHDGIFLIGSQAGDPEWTGRKESAQKFFFQ